MKILFLLFILSLTLVNVTIANSPYQVEVVQSADISKHTLLGGRVVSSSVVHLSSQLSGDVIDVKGVEGSYFNKGDQIVILEQVSITAQRDSVIAEISSARESLKNTKVQYSQSLISPYSNQMFGGAFNSFTNPMNRMSGNSNPDFDKFANRTDKYTGVQQAKNRLKQAQLKLKQIEEKLDNTIITAPFDGVVIDKNINVGDVVQVGQSLFKFSNLTQLQVEINVPSRLLRDLKINKKYRVKIDNLSQSIIAKLVQIYPIADNSQHSIKIKLDLPKDIPILPGVYAELELSLVNNNKIPVIPVSSILWNSSLPSVFVVDKYNKTELRFIRIGNKINGKSIEVLSGLKIGQRIITNPNVFTTSGISI